MCKDCLFEVRPDVENQASDSGANMVNFKGCVQCGRVTLLLKEIVSHDIEDGDSEDDDTSEELRFKHVCSECKHVIADHFYTYLQDHEEQSYNMDCFLCGKGGYSVKFDEVFNVLKDDAGLVAAQGQQQKQFPPPKETNFAAALMASKFIPQAEEQPNAEDDAEWE